MSHPLPTSWERAPSPHLQAPASTTILETSAVPLRLASPWTDQLLLDPPLLDPPLLDHPLLDHPLLDHPPVLPTSP